LLSDLTKQVHIRDRYEQQQHATDAFFDAAARADRIRQQLDRIEHEQEQHAAALAIALATAAAAAATITGWPTNRVRAALSTRHRAANGTDAIDDREQDDGR
jgi:polysaccharide deacetylase 2 family uncharacterized protein YibQ